MNILGHSYIAVQTVPEGKKQLLIIGSLLPESSPFISNNPFTWEEIHEGGEKFLEFLAKNYPAKRDLALGMLTHSKRFGADGFNKEIEKYAASHREKLGRKIAECSDIDLETAIKWRLHNFLWAGVDFWILEEYLEFVKGVQGAIRALDIEKISSLLAEAFSKEQARAKMIVRTLFRRIYRPEDLNSVKGLARSWARQAAGLPEKDRVNVPKAEKVIKKCAKLLENDWQDILRLVETKVGKNLRPFC